MSTTTTILEDDESMARTRERTPERLTTLRLPVTSALAAPPVTPAVAWIVPDARTADASPLLLNRRRIALGSYVLLSCMLAAIIGVTAGRAAAPAALERAPRMPVVLAAREAVLERPLSAPEKDLSIESVAPPEPTAETPAPVPHPLHRPGFRHLGADRSPYAARHPFSS